MVRYRLWIRTIAGLLFLFWISACQVSGIRPGEASPTSPTVIRVTREPSATATAPPTLPPTSTTALTSTPIPSPTVVSYAPLSQDNLHLLAKVGAPIGVTQFYAPAANWIWAPRVVQLVFREEDGWVVDLKLHNKPPQNEIRVRNLENGEAVANLVDETGGEKTVIELLVASPNGRLLASVSPLTNHISLWDFESMEKIAVLEFSGYQSTSWMGGDVGLAGSFSSDGKYLAVAGCRYLGEYCLSAGVTVYDVPNGEIIEELVGQQAFIADVRFLPGTWTLIMIGDGEPIRDADMLVWDVAGNEKVAEVSLGREREFGGKIILDDDGSVLASHVYAGNDSWIIFWDVPNWTIRHEVPIARSLICSRIYTFIPHTRTLAYACKSSSGNPPEYLFFTDIDGNVPITELTTSLSDIANIFASPDGRFLYTYDVQGFTGTKFLGPHIQRWGVKAGVTGAP